jgi:antitoxin (DNA-binding transcriptional repressor) of toxin-antitoxin stability system
MKATTIKKIILTLLFVVTAFIANAQTILNADNTANNTYELINSVLAPGATAIETPDQSPDGLHTSFGRHIAEVFDTDLNKNVFEFYSHVIPDNDVTGGLDRQRVEMKTFGASPNNLKGVLGETVTYKWRFKLPIGFKPSNNFTHIHQVKAVDGDDSSPIFTLTPRYGTPNTMQLLYVVDSNGSNDYKAEVNLSLFEGIWVEAIEVIKIGTGTSGTYSIVIKKVSDGTVLLSYSSNAIQTIRTAATDTGFPQVANSFIRPKWGIYRSLADSGNLRDESLRIADVLIAEGLSSQVSLNQTITFNALPTKIVGAADFSAGASASSGLTVLVTSSNSAVATIVGGTIHIVGSGTTTITASQSGNTTYNAAANVTQTLTVDKMDQTITFNALPAKVEGDADFSAGASASSGLTVSLTSSNTAVATIVSGAIHIVGFGATTITASQIGDGTYNAAADVLQTLSVTALTHTIRFLLPLKYTNSADFDPGAVSSIGSPIIYTSSNQAVATIVDNKVHIVAKGTSNITASAVGNGSYNAVVNVQQLIVQCSCVQN